MPFLGIPSGLTFHRIVVLFRLPLRFATVSYAARLIIDVVHEIGYQKGILLLSQRKICGIHMLPCLISWLFGSLCPAVMSIAPGEPNSWQNYSCSRLWELLQLDCWPLLHDQASC